LRAQVLSLCAVLAGAAVVPFGLRAVNAALPGADVRPSYAPTIETPRPRSSFDESAASELREAQPEFVVIGDSTAGGRIHPGDLSRLTGRSAAGVFRVGTPVAYWFLVLKNLVAENGLKNIKGAIVFFRDDQLTTQVEAHPPDLDRVAREYEPEIDRVWAAYRLGRFSGVHRLARAAYQFDRTRVWLEPQLTQAPAGMVASRMPPADLLHSINTEIFALDRLRKFEAADLPVSEDAFLNFSANVDRSLLPEFIRLAERANLRLGFIRVQRRPRPDGPPLQSDALARYVEDLRAYLEARDVYFGDDYGDPALTLDTYADGDHLRPDALSPYTAGFAKKHARFFQ
jgi:hypothetical protein